MNYDSDASTRWSKFDTTWSSNGADGGNDGAGRSSASSDAWSRWDQWQDAGSGRSSDRGYGTGGYGDTSSYGSSTGYGYAGGYGSASGYGSATDYGSGTGSSWSRDSRDDDGQDRSTRRRSGRSNRSGSRSSTGGRRKNEHAKSRRRSGVPVLVTLLVVLLSAGVSVFVTRTMMTPQIEEAQSEAEQAKSQVSTLTAELVRVSTELDSKTEELEKLQAKSDKSKDKDASADSKTAGVDDPWVDSGKFTSGDTALDSEVKAYCDSLVDTSMDRDTAVFEVYKSIAWSDYVERDAAQHPSGKDWRTEFARMYYENDTSGNCYEFAAFLSYCMRYLGFDDATAQGVLVELQGGGWGDHGIVYVTSAEGEACICDTARGTNGWMIPEGSYNVQLQDFENA